MSLLASTNPRLILFPSTVQKPQHIHSLVRLLADSISHTAQKPASSPPFLCLFRKCAWVRVNLPATPLPGLLASSFLQPSLATAVYKEGVSVATANRPWLATLVNAYSTCNVGKSQLVIIFSNRAPVMMMECNYVASAHFVFKPRDAKMSSNPCYVMQKLTHKWLLFFIFVPAFFFFQHFSAHLSGFAFHNFNVLVSSHRSN